MKNICSSYLCSSGILCISIFFDYQWSSSFVCLMAIFISWLVKYHFFSIDVLMFLKLMLEILIAFQILRNVHFIRNDKILFLELLQHQVTPSISESHSVVSDSLQPYGLYRPWNSPCESTGVGSLSLLQRIFPTQGSNPGLLHCRHILYQLSHKGSPRILEWVAYTFSS